MKYYLIAFDITDDKIRLNVGKQLLRYGNRVQKSVFEVRVKNINELDKLMEKCNALIEKDDDIRYYLLCASCRKQSLDAKGQAVMEVPIAIIV
jgi:CRISPR-associated protein Cas2